jgi:hypothetical protein
MAAGLEGIQFVVTLTKKKEILKQLRTNGMERKDAEGPYFSIQFDSKEFKFRPGVEFTVGKTVGNALIRNSAVLLGNDPLSDDFVPFVEKLNELSLGQPAAKKPQFECPICHVDQKSGPKLARHLMDKKAHEQVEEEPEPVDESDSTDGADEDNDTQLVETNEAE